LISTLNYTILNTSLLLYVEPASDQKIFMDPTYLIERKMWIWCSHVHAS